MRMAGQQVLWIRFSISSFSKSFVIENAIAAVASNTIGTACRHTLQRHEGQVEALPTQFWDVLLLQSCKLFPQAHVFCVERLDYGGGGIQI
jgi:hypothetical protein